MSKTLVLFFKVRQHTISYSTKNNRPEEYQDRSVRMVFDNRNVQLIQVMEE